MDREKEPEKNIYRHIETDQIKLKTLDRPPKVPVQWHPEETKHDDHAIID